MNEPINIGIIPEPVKSIPEHEHILWEVVYYTHGEGTLKVGDSEYSFKPKVIIFQPPEVSHSESSQLGFKNVFYLFKTTRDLGTDIIKFSDNESGDFFTILMLIYKEFRLRQANWKSIVDRLTDVLFEYMLSWSTNSKKNQFVEQFERVLASNVSNSYFRIHEAMKDIPLSTFHFRNLFKKETGKTPLDYLTEKRIFLSMQILGNSMYVSKTIREVADLVGFEDPYYFSRVFRKVTGKSPTEWKSASNKLPDLVIRCVFWTPEKPKEGDIVSFCVTVANIGIAATPDGTVLGVGFYLDDNQQSAICWSDYHIRPLAPGKSIVLKSNGSQNGSVGWIAQKGVHRVTAFVDDAFRISEDDRDNNRFIATIKVYDK